MWTPAFKCFMLMHRTKTITPKNKEEMKMDILSKTCFEKSGQSKAHWALGRGWVQVENTYTLLSFTLLRFSPHSLRDRVNCGVLVGKGVWDGRQLSYPQVHIKYDPSCWSRPLSKVWCGGARDYIMRSQRLYGGQSALQSSDQVQTLDLGFQTLTKMNNDENNMRQNRTCGILCLYQKIFLIFV